jgi:hypothetical protein
MDRQNLILRRFGVLSFGLGYFADGVWVDHAELADRGAGLDISGAGSDVDRDEVHAWLGCCAESAQPAAMDGSGRATPVPIQSPAGTPAQVLHAEPHVDAVAGRSSAL